MQVATGKSGITRLENRIMPLKIAFGADSDVGMKIRNEDFFGLVAPEGELLASKGIVAAIADGAGGGSNGREAAEYAVLSVLSDYYDTPETWEVPHALGKLLASANRWLLAQGATRREFSCMASTLSLLVLRGNRYVIAHVGDTRIYRMRGKEFSLLTRDHVWEEAHGRHVLKRAVGLDLNLVVDYDEGELEKGDVFLLASDGVWEVLGPDGLEEVLNSHPQPEEAARALVDAAIGKGGEGNATAQVIRIDDLAEGTFGDLLKEGADLPFPPMLVPGQRIDSFEVIEQLHESAKRVIYKVKDLASGRILAMKTLKPEFVMDGRARNDLLIEEWLVKKSSSPFLPRHFQAKRHFLYFLTSWHEGSTLREMLDHGHHFTIAETIQIGMKLARALGSLHRLDIIHRDIRPENLHLGKDGKLRILSLSSAINPSIGGTAFSAQPNYASPECLGDGEPCMQSDIFAMGVTLYHMLTGEYPYSGSFDPVKPARYRPDIPAWLENVIMKSIARDPERRFEMPEECLIALENGESAPVAAPPRTPVVGRYSAWKLTAVISMLVNFLLLYFEMVESAGISSGPPW